MSNRAALIAGTALLLAGCTPVEMRGDDARTCQADPVQRYVGQPGEAGAILAAKRASGAHTVRVVRPGEAVTMDFRADRLTVTVDKHGLIALARCG